VRFGCNAQAFRVIEAMSNGDDDKKSEKKVPRVTGRRKRGSSDLLFLLAKMVAPGPARIAVLGGFNLYPIDPPRAGIKLSRPCALYWVWRKFALDFFPCH